MLKLTAVVSLMLIGSTLWAASLSCDSCGSECASACGTRHFRSCCFNYLRRKRGPEAIKFHQQYQYDLKPDRQQRSQPFYVIDNAEPSMYNLVSSDLKSYPYEDTLENRLQMIYDN